MQFILDEYKSQQAVERGFRFLKSPDFLTSSLFLKKPERIEALLMVVTNMMDRQRIVLKCLGKSYWEFYS
jgi:transposase